MIIQHSGFAFGPTASEAQGSGLGFRVEGVGFRV